MQVVCGIILSFPRLYPTGGQITHALLSRLPLYHCGRSHDHARLACIKRAASVHPEPGSNSLNENLTSFHYSAVKEPSLPVACSLDDQRVPQLYRVSTPLSIPAEPSRATSLIRTFIASAAWRSRCQMARRGASQTAASRDPHPIEPDAIKPGLRVSDRRIARG